MVDMKKTFNFFFLEKYDLKEFFRSILMRKFDHKNQTI